MPNFDFPIDLTELRDILEAGFIMLTLDFLKDFPVSCFGEGLMIMLVPNVSVLSLLLIEDFFDLEYLDADLWTFTGSSKVFCLNVGPLFKFYDW